MKLFMPTARETNGLLIVGFLSLGYALYLRYMAVEPQLVAHGCAVTHTWLCLTRSVVVQLFMHSVFGLTALALALINLIRPSLILFGAALMFAAFGLVLYNTASSALAVALLILSFARRVPE